MGGLPVFKAVFICNNCAREKDGRFITDLPKGWVALLQDVPKGHYREQARTAEWHFCSMKCVAEWSTLKAEQAE